MTRTPARIPGAPPDERTYGTISPATAARCCPYCGKLLSPLAPRAVYCSPAHRVAAYREKERTILSTAEVARRSGRSRHAVKRAAMSGALVSFWVDDNPARRVFSLANVERWIGDLHEGESP